LKDGPSLYKARVRQFMQHRFRRPLLAKVCSSGGECEESMGGGLRRHARCAEWCVLALEVEEAVRHRVQLVIECLDCLRALFVCNTKPFSTGKNGVCFLVFRFCFVSVCGFRCSLFGIPFSEYYVYFLEFLVSGVVGRYYRLVFGYRAFGFRVQFSFSVFSVFQMCIIRLHILRYCLCVAFRFPFVCFSSFVCSLFWFMVLCLVCSVLVL
jgi:hypothetical protein